jgi:branched-chain amino acid aminotransferase
MWIYLNGRFVPEQEAVVSVFDRGFLFGDGLFETVRAYSGNLFRLGQHLTRLADAADTLSIPLPPVSTLAASLRETLSRNDLSDAILRLTVTRGIGAAWVDPATLTEPTCVIVPRAPIIIPPEKYAAGCSAVTVRHDASCLPDANERKMKSLSFLNHVLAKMEAGRRGADEAIILRNGHLTEATVSNLFWVSGSFLKTPALSTGILEGVTRGVVMELAGTARLTVQEGLYEIDDLSSADEAFLTNTGHELFPLTSIDGHFIASGRVGPITQRLHHLFRQQVEKETSLQ